MSGREFKEDYALNYDERKATKSDQIGSHPHWKGRGGQVPPYKHTLAMTAPVIYGLLTMDQE